MTQLSTRVREATERESTAASDLASVRAELTTMRINMQRLEEEAKQASKQAAWLQEELDAKTDALSTARRQLSSTQVELQGQVDALTQRAEAAEAREKDTSSEAATLRNTVADLRKKLQDAEAGNEEMQGHLRRQLEVRTARRVRWRVNRWRLVMNVTRYSRPRPVLCLW